MIKANTKQRLPVQKQELASQRLYAVSGGLGKSKDCCSPTMNDESADHFRTAAKVLNHPRTPRFDAGTSFDSFGSPSTYFGSSLR